MNDPIHILSLGAGVQSSTLALMAAEGAVGPMPVAAIFADTQDEPAGVYKWLDWLETKLPYPVYRVTNGKLSERALLVKTSRDGRRYTQTSVPYFTKDMETGDRGKIMGRICTADFKLKPLLKKAKELAGVRRAEKELRAIQWIGISLDEVQRMKPARYPWIKHRWPLIELEMTRHDCKRWLSAHGYPEPPRSACRYCPFKSDNEWRQQRDNEPIEFQKSVDFERQLQAVKAASDDMGGVPFLHASLKPLDQVDFSTDTDKGQGILFGNECEGLCGV